MNLPNSLTLFRIFLIPLLIVVLLTRFPNKEFIGVAIFLAAALTDWLDGYLARRRREVTTLGMLLDPIADKLLTVSAFISLVEMDLAPAWMVVVIVGREFAVSGMRNIAASRGLIMAASVWGKYKTVSQVVAIALLILTKYVAQWVRFVNLGQAALWVVMILAIVSMAHYFISFIKSVDLRSEA